MDLEFLASPVAMAAWQWQPCQTRGDETHLQAGVLGLRLEPFASESLSYFLLAPEVPSRFTLTLTKIVNG